jgi:hypothetical protein
MWERTKRLINSYLNELIERSSSADREVRQITRAEISRLAELEVQTRASIKLLEKELAETELKMIGVAEREKMAREQGNAAVASSAGDALIALAKQRELLKQQISEANMSAERAKSLREERRLQGEELVNETYLSSMRENIAGMNTSFDPTDPAGTIDEMRSRLGNLAVPSVDARLAEAEREFEKERARKAADDLLAHYKETLAGGEASKVVSESRSPIAEATPPSAGAGSPSEPEESQETKTLGRNDGPIRPID